MSGNRTPSLRQSVTFFARLVQLIRPYWVPLIKSMVLGLATGLVGVAIPYVTKLLIDEVYPSQNVTLMHLLVGGLMVLHLVSTGLGAVRGFYSLYVHARLSNITRLMFFNHLQHLKMRFFEGHQVGEIQSRFQDVTNGIGAISRVFEAVFIHGIYLVLVPPLLFLLDWRLAFLALGSSPVVVVITVMAARFQRQYWRRSSEASADLDAYQVEVLSHIRTYKGMGLEHKVYGEARGRVVRATETRLKAGGLAHCLGGLTEGIKAVNTGALSWLGWTLILGNQMTLGDFIAFTFYINLLYQPMFALVKLFSELQQSAVHLSRMFEYLDCPVEQDPNQAYEPPPPITRPLAGAFSLRNVSFAYRDDQPVLQQVELEIEAGSVIAVVGPSGSGKTTLLRLFSALDEPDVGTVRVDGVPLREFPLSELRRQIAVVWQEVGLIEGTLWDNLTLGASSPSAERVDATVRLCGLDDIVAEFPEHYQTRVAEGGASLSAGQQQRLAMARALLCGNPILLLDEATANVDVETETRILRDIFAHRQRQTIIYVTHRLAAAALADRIVVMESGRLAGFGPHRDLIESCATYQRMYRASNTSVIGSSLRVVPRSGV